MHPAHLRIFKTIALSCLGLCLSLCLAQALSPQNNQGITQATVKEIIDGTEVFIQNQQAKVNDVAQLRQRVRTGDARAELTFNTGVVARLSKNSILTVGECARLQRGTLLVNGAANGCTSSIVAAVRGTTYILEVDQAGKQEVKVLEGEVVIRREATPDPAEVTIDAPKVKQSPTFGQPVPPPTTDTRPLPPLDAKPANNQPVLTPSPSPTPSPQSQNEVVLKAGESLDIDPNGILSAVQKISQADFENLLKGALFQGFTSQLPSINNIRSVFEKLFPGASFPISIPSIPSVPSIPRLPF